MEKIKKQIACGEDSRNQFKADTHNVDSLAAEMAAFANSEGGTIYIGVPEIPQLVFEELLVNALIHRDYFVSAVIRIFIFDDRIEIISPGHLPDNLTIEKIRTGNSNIRNPILASFVAKKMLSYRGFGSGIRRSLEKWSDIDFFAVFKIFEHNRIVFAPYPAEFANVVVPHDLMRFRSAFFSIALFTRFIDSFHDSKQRFLKSFNFSFKAKSGFDLLIEPTDNSYSDRAVI